MKQLRSSVWAPSGKAEGFGFDRHLPFGNPNGRFGLCSFIGFSRSAECYRFTRWRRILRYLARWKVGVVEREIAGLDEADIVERTA